MDSKGAAPTKVYEDFVPTTELVQEQDSDTLLLDLTGFQKEQVRVQLTRTGILKISGQRPVTGENKWLRFQKDFPVTQNCDKTKISAKFENGILYVKQPKLITSSEKKGQELPTSDAQQPNKPADEPQPTPQKKDEEQTKGEKTPPTTEELPKHQDTNADKPEKKEPNTKETKDLAEKTPAEKIKDLAEKTPAEKIKDLPEKTPAEKTDASSTVEDGNRPSSVRKLENDADVGTAAVLAEKLKMPRKLMNMTLIALLVLVIGLYISNMMKSNKYIAEE